MLRNGAVLVMVFVCQLAGQDAAGISTFFEGKQVVVKMDLPGTQQGVDIFPQRTQALDLKSYSNRIKKFGTSLRNGDRVLVTKVKVKNDSIEFQLGGGGYGTASDDTDSSVHYTPSDKSGREKDLEDQIKNETDPDRRRSLERELDDVRARRERRDDRDKAAAEDAAESKKQRIDIRRQQGGSRFNIRFDKVAAPGMTRESVMAALAPYVEFPPETFGNTDAAGARNRQPVSDPKGPPAPVATAPSQDTSNGVQSLKKGLTRSQVEGLFGQATETHDRSQDGLRITSCTYQTKDALVKTDFVNGVLVGYTVSSR